MEVNVTTLNLIRLIEMVEKNFGNIPDRNPERNVITQELLGGVLAPLHIEKWDPIEIYFLAIAFVCLMNFSNLFVTPAMRIRGGKDADAILGKLPKKKKAGTDGRKRGRARGGKQEDFDFFVGALAKAFHALFQADAFKDLLPQGTQLTQEGLQALINKAIDRMDPNNRGTLEKGVNTLLSPPKLFQKAFSTLRIPSSPIIDAYNNHLEALERLLTPEGIADFLIHELNIPIDHMRAGEQDGEIDLRKAMFRQQEIMHASQDE
jgi:hypothetical protein